MLDCSLLLASGMLELLPAKRWSSVEKPVGRREARSSRPEQRTIFHDVLRFSERLVVMSKKAADILRDIYHVAEEKIDLIPHGIPDVPFVDSNLYKDQLGVGGKLVVLTFGLLSPNKGIENVLNALPEVVAKFPNVESLCLSAMRAPSRAQSMTFCQMKSGVTRCGKTHTASAAKWCGRTWLNSILGALSERGRNSVFNAFLQGRI